MRKKKNFLLIVLLLLLPLGLYGCLSEWWMIDPPGGPDNAESLQIIPNRFIVLFTEPYPSISYMESAIVGARGTIDRVLPEFGMVVAESEDPGFIGALEGDPAVELVFNDAVIQWIPEKPDFKTDEGLPEVEAPDPYPANWALQWDKRIIDADDAWAITRGDPAVEIAIIDTGIDPEVLDLQGKVDFAKSTSFVTTGMPTPAGEPAWLDLNGHGTMVAGIAAASGNYRLIGVCPNCTLIAVRVLDSTGSGYFSDVLSGIYHAASVGADIANMSLGPAEPYPLADPDVADLAKAMARAINEAGKMGTLVIDSTGNADLNADADRSLWYNNSQFAMFMTGTAATGPGDVKASYSNYGKTITYISAPGGDDNPRRADLGFVWGPCARALCDKFNGPHPVYGAGGWIVGGTGTSFAAPNASGVAGLADSTAGGALDPIELRTILANTADDLGSPGFDIVYGHGRVNAFKAID